MLSHNIKKMRQLAGLNQTELAERLHVSQGAVSQWERGYARPDTETLFAIANVLNVSIDELASEEKENQKTKMLQENSGILEALHQNPRLGMLFDRSRKMDASQIEAMLTVADAILKERDGD